MPFQENIVLCSVLSIVNGILFTLSSAATAYPAHLDRMSKLQNQNDEHIETWNETFILAENKKKESESNFKPVSKRMWTVAYILNVVFQIVGGIIQLVSTFFGPVSIGTPLSVASGIVSSMVIFSYILKIEEKPSKDTRVGTYILSLSSILLIFVGAEVGGETWTTDLLLENKTSYTTIIVFLAITLVLWPAPFLIGFTDIAVLHKYNVQYFLLFTNEVFITVTGTTANKIFGMMESNTAIAVSFFVIFFGLSMPQLYTSLIRSIVLKNQSKYMAANFSAYVAVNALAGYFIWSDEFINLPAYIICMLFYLLGVYLVSDFNMLDHKGYHISDVVDDEDGKLQTSVVQSTLIRSSIVITAKENNVSKLMESKMILTKSLMIPKITQDEDENDDDDVFPKIKDSPDIK